MVDDLAWSRNDAFLILMFNTGALAILPRLGNHLIKIYNPTIINVHFNDAADFTNYRVPRAFNELIQKTEITNKVKKHITTSVSGSRWRLTVHPSEEAFIVYSGSVAFLMQLEVSHDMQGLFNQPKSQYLITRFYNSMHGILKNH